MLRYLFPLVLAGALVWLGWETPFRDRFYGPPPKPPVKIARQPTQAPPPSGAWMWDPNRRTTLDAPARLSTGPTAPPSTHTGSWMWERRPMDAPARSPTPHR